MKKTVIDKSKWKRNDLFEHYDNCTNPFIFLTTQIDITNLYNYVKTNKLSFYPTYGYIIAKAINKIEAFKYRKEKDKIVLYDELIPNFTDNINGETLFFFSVPFTNNLEKFIENYHIIREENIKNRKNANEYNNNEIWLSCAPWMKMNSLVPPFDKNNTIPQIIWDKFEFNNNKVTINMLIMVHHGFVDGFHIGKLINSINEEINNLKD